MHAGSISGIPAGVDIRTDVKTQTTQLQILSDALKQAIRISQSSFTYTPPGMGKKVDIAA